MIEIAKMPDEYKGKATKKTDLTLSVPRKWTDMEIEWIKKLIKQGYTAIQIAESVDRSPTSVSIKIKRLGKSDNTYNKKHVIEKYEINNLFLDCINPTSVLDVYCGKKDFYAGYSRTTNDIDNNVPADYHKDAFKLMCQLYAEGMSFDLIDLDPFGSAFDCFDLAIKMAHKGLAITLGELGHKRWKRLDFVSRYYDIDNLSDFTIENLIAYIQKIGLRNKKNLIVFAYKEWQNIGRVWFKVEEKKIIESQIHTDKSMPLIDYKNYSLFDLIQECNK